MKRRVFLQQGVRGMVGMSLLPFMPERPRQTAGARRTLASTVSDFERGVPSLMARHAVPGLSIVAIRDGRLAWTRGLGFKNAATKAPVTADTIFNAGSMSKAVFAYAALKLCERGVLDLDAPLSKYSPDRFLEGDSRLESVTARRVLSHTAGFQNYRSGNSPLRIHFEPGERFMYSGEGYYYLQSVIARLVGHVDRTSCSRFEAELEVCSTDFDAFMTSNLLGPFDMTSSGYVWQERLADRWARGHDVDGSVLEVARPTAVDAARYGSTGLLYTTPTDSAKFLIEVLEPKPADDFRLGRALREEMLRRHIEAPEMHCHWGLGWMIFPSDDDTLIGHGGGNRGWNCYSLASRKTRSGFVVMTNGGNSGLAFVYEMLTPANPLLANFLE